MRPLPRVDLAREVAAPVALALLVNAFIALLGFRGTTGVSDSPLAPPGWVIGVIWTVLFALMGAARHAARGDAGLRSAISGFVILCATYPFLTALFPSRAAALLADGVAGAYAAGLVFSTLGRRPVVAGLVLPVLVWILFATYLVVRS